jgi:pimeloyl-ACP methyl ester carboxylesterase
MSRYAWRVLLILCCLSIPRSWAGPLVERIRRERAVILFDVRGTGLSEALDCVMPATQFNSSDQARSTFEEMHEVATQCAQQLGARVRHHTNREVIEDLERLRSALGLQQINLWGGSFGTRVAQHYVRAYGKHVRSMPPSTSSCRVVRRMHAARRRFPICR